MRLDGERNRRSSSGQRFAPRPSAADCPAEDHRSLSPQELRNNLTLFLTALALRPGPLSRGLLLCRAIVSGLPDCSVEPDTGAPTLRGSFGGWVGMGTPPLQADGVLGEQVGMSQPPPAKLKEPWADGRNELPAPPP